MNDIMEWMNHVGSLPEPLATIMMENWDETGRPTNENPQSHAIIAAIKKNFSTGRDAFISDMKLMFPQTQRYEAAAYYDCFVAGVKALMKE